MKNIKPLLNNLVKKHYIIPILLFLFTFLVFNIGLRYISSGDIRPNELLPISLIYERDFDFNEFVDDKSDLPYWFQNYNGKILSIYPIVPGLLNLPAHLIAFIFGINLLENSFLLSMISASLISSLSVVFMYLCLVKVCRKQLTAVVFALTYAFTTSVWSITSRGIWQHGPSLLFLTISLSILFSKNKNMIPYSGFFLGMAVFNRPSNIIIVLPLTLYVFFEFREHFKKFALFAAIPAFLFGFYIYLHPAFGGQGLTKYVDVLFSYEGDPELKHYMSEQNGFFSGNILSGLMGLLISPSRGLFIYSPIFVFSFIFLFYALFSKKIKVIYKYLAISIFTLILVYSKFVAWWGGWTFGYRFLIELLPMLIIFLALSWEGFIQKNKYLKAIFILFLFISLYFHFLGAYYYPCGFDYSPNNIDYDIERLWDVKDSQIVRCAKRMLHGLHLYNLKEHEKIMFDVSGNYFYYYSPEEIKDKGSLIQ